MFVFQKDNRVFAARSGLDKSLGILGGAREHDAPPGDVGQEGFDTSRMPRAAFDVTTNGYANDYGAGPNPLAAPPHRGYFVPDLHKSRPHVVRKLDLYDWLVPTDGHSPSHTDDACFRERAIIHAIGILGAESARDTENATLRVRDILSPHDDLGIQLHLFPKAAIDGLDEADRLLGNISDWRNLPRCIRRRFRVNVSKNVVGSGWGRLTGEIGGMVDFLFDLAAQMLHLFLTQKSVTKQVLFGLEDGVAFEQLIQFLLTSVFFLIVGGGMRIHADHLALDESGAASSTHLLDNGREHLVHWLKPSAVDGIAGHSEPLSDAVNFGAGLHDLGNTDRVPVVLNNEKNGQTLPASPVERLEEFALAGGTLAGCNIDDLIAAVFFNGTGHPYGGKELRSCGCRLGNEAQLARRPVFRHVATCRIGITLPAQHPQKDIFEGHAQPDRYAFPAIVRKEPIVAWLQQQRHANLEFLVASRGCVKANFSESVEDFQSFFNVVHGEHLAVKI